MYTAACLSLSHIALPDLMVFGQKVHELLQECAAVANDADHPFLSMKVDGKCPSYLLCYTAPMHC